MHIIHITTGFPPTRHDKAGTPVYRVVKELNSKIDVIVPITTRKIHENIFTGIVSRIIQHELDHLNGRLMLQNNIHEGFIDEIFLLENK